MSERIELPLRPPMVDPAVELFVTEGGMVKVAEKLHVATSGATSVHVFAEDIEVARRICRSPSVTRIQVEKRYYLSLAVGHFTVEGRNDEQRTRITHDAVVCLEALRKLADRKNVGKDDCPSESPQDDYLVESTEAHTYGRGSIPINVFIDGNRFRCDPVPEKVGIIVHRRPEFSSPKSMLVFEDGGQLKEDQQCRLMRFPLIVVTGKLTCPTEVYRQRRPSAGEIKETEMTEEIAYQFFGKKIEFPFQVEPLD